MTNLGELHDGLRAAGVRFERGLSPDELRNLESRWAFHFPPDLEEFLARGMPVSHGFIEWRNAPPAQIESALKQPLEGICFDIEHNAFWPDEWGERPEDDDDAFAIAERHVLAAPRLIPVRGHRYLPDAPREAGNPVFSVCQTDIIVYGNDLDQYIRNEFYAQFLSSLSDRVYDGCAKTIPFWSQLVELNERPDAHGRLLRT
jgi:hypothetical protein